MSLSLLHRLSQLDDELVAALQVDIEEFNDSHFEQRLAERTALLQKVIAQAEATEQQVQDIIRRSRQLTHLAEAVKDKLGEQLKVIQKGRRSQQAYDSVKYQE